MACQQKKAAVALTKRKRLFVAEYLADPKCNASEAAIRAGFSEKRAKVTASELLKDPEVTAAIEHKRNQRLARLDIDANLVLAGLLELRDRCIEAGAGSWQTAGLLKVYELLGRHLKMFTEKIEVGLDEELIKRLEAGRKRTALLVAPKTESK
jgi:phage terminase small subunit